ncbi:autotransporter outer membrane beta-barrel domain-containing protein [Serratia plymuthica]|uniref:autotransporter outer membrane beta-barrel domain-containing protein n=1 Tax=Serratia plymuthica TaxID=82996 RepID=UPI0018D85539|nr:autotransporter outer membrane beta-barrel domain-containing protein [Serratia plymuthica]QPS55186.1 autotransporter outer membrane beta-barrel domain-containing protein [Serratia plymuthica]CAI1922329.1 Outer membrane protein IcsA autotransporter precursor [Serratia plymuthica]
MNDCIKKKWNISLLLYSPLYVSSLFLASGSYVWAANNDTIIANGTVRSINGLTLENNTNGDFIIQAKNGADFTATRLQLNSSGSRGGGAWIDNSKFTAQELQINVSGSSGTGIYLANNGEAVLSNITVLGQKSALGLVLDGVWSTSQSIARAQVNDSTIVTAGGDAIRVMAGELALNNVAASTLDNNSYALNANMAAKIDVEGGRFATQGVYSDAVWIASKDSSVMMNNAVITTKGERAIAVNAQQGAAKITNSTIETLGGNAYGLYTEKLVQGDELSITTAGARSAGFFTALGGTGTLTNSTIITRGELAPGLLAYPGSQIIADNVRIETAGKEGFGLWSRAGSLNIGNSLITTSGEGAVGLYVNGYSSTTPLSNNVLLDNVLLKSELAQVIDVNTTDLALEVKDSVLSSGNNQLMTVSNYEDVLEPANNIYSNVSLNATNSMLDGDIAVANPGNSVNVNLRSGSVLNGAVNNASSLTLDSSSTWNMNNSSVVRQLSNNGTVVFSDRNKFDTLTVSGDYSGNNGTLVMNSLLGADDSPVNKLIVTGDVQQGATNVSINDLGGHGAQTIEGVKIVDVGGTSWGRFVKTDRIVAGAYDYDLIKKGQSWYLTSNLINPEPAPEPIPEPIPEPESVPAPEPMPDPQPTKPSIVRPEGGSYTANLAAANNLFMMTLHDRLGETQYIDALTGQPEVTSLWLRQLGGRNVWRDGSGQQKTQSNRYMTQIGGDVARWSTDGLDRWHIGFMAGYGNNHSASRNQVSGYGSKGSVDGYSVGSYATWYANNEKPAGAYLDSWLLYSWFNNDVSGEKLANENYKSHGITASLEGGYTWKIGQSLGSHGTLNEWFIQPQAQVVWMGVRADSLQEANGTQVSGEGDGNIMTRLGIKTYLKGHHAQDNGKQREFQPYIELNWLHNTRHFATKMDDVRIRQNGTKNLAEAKVGLEGQINPRLNLWGNVSVKMGDAGYNDNTAMLGMKYHF